MSSLKNSIPKKNELTTEAKTKAGKADETFVNFMRNDYVYDHRDEIDYKPGLKDNTNKTVSRINAKLKTIKNDNDREETVRRLSSALDGSVYDDAGVMIYDKKKKTITYDANHSEIDKYIKRTDDVGSYKSRSGHNREITDDIDYLDKIYKNKPGTKDYYVWGKKSEFSSNKIRQQVKSMKASGKTNAEIADALGITDVSYYLYS